MCSLKINYCTLYHTYFSGGTSVTDNQKRVKDSEDLSFFTMITKKYHDFAKQKLSGYNFTPNEISTMIYLLENEDIDTAKGISVRYGITQSLICRSVDSLTKKGYLSVAVDPNDRRVNHLTLHIEDETLLDILHGMNSSYMDYIFQGVAPEDVETFRKVLNSVIANIR